MNAERIFVREIGGIYRLKVPFDDLYTSVFLVQTDEKYILVDCATTARDVDEYIEPALEKFGLTFSDIDFVIVTHDHDDHSGGLLRILQKNPNVRAVRGVEEVIGLEIYPLCGHTKDFIGVFDEKSGTLISGDGLQGDGIGKYRCGVADKEEYLRSIEKIERDKRIKNMLFSHAYEPWNKDGVFGRSNVEDVLLYCKNSVLRSNKD